MMSQEKNAKKPGTKDTEKRATNDEIAREKDRLAHEHSLKLDAIVETTDEALVVTEREVGGKTMRVETRYEARHKNHDKERQQAKDSIQEARHAATGISKTEKNQMSFRTRMAYEQHLREQDQGRGRGW